MFSLYSCVCNFIVCMVYSCVRTLFALMQRWAAARFCHLQPFAAVFIIAAVSIPFALCARFDHLRRTI